MMKVLGKLTNYPFRWYMLVLLHTVILKLLMSEVEASLVRLPEHAACIIPLKKKDSNIGNKFQANPDAMDQSNIAGTCLRKSKCPQILETMNKMNLNGWDVHCGYLAFEQILCCPKTEVKAGDLANKACDNIINQRKQVYNEGQIAGGDAVQLGEFPHMAALVINNKIICGGSLIADRFVLTAAHCVNKIKNIDELEVYFGVTKFRDENQRRNAIIASVESFAIHPKYRGYEKYNDIAVIKLTENIASASNVFPACLHTNSVDQFIGDELYVTGWGLQDTHVRENSDVLLQTKIAAISLEDCQKKYVNHQYELSRGILETQICTLDTNYKKDACKGDSGGPLSKILDNEYKKYIVVGVIADGEGCANSMPGIYTRVSEYLEFIENIVWK